METKVWKYTKHAACHWLVNFNLKLATLSEPKHTWRILTSPLHSTVWNGEDILFEFNFKAFGVKADECFELANQTELLPGEYHKTYVTTHFKRDKKAPR